MFDSYNQTSNTWHRTLGKHLDTQKRSLFILSSPSLESQKSIGSLDVLGGETDKKEKEEKKISVPF